MQIPWGTARARDGGGGGYIESIAPLTGGKNICGRVGWPCSAGQENQTPRRRDDRIEELVMSVRVAISGSLSFHTITTVPKPSEAGRHPYEPHARFARNTTHKRLVSWRLELYTYTRLRGHLAGRRVRNAKYCLEIELNTRRLWRVCGGQSFSRTAVLGPYTRPFFSPPCT